MELYIHDNYVHPTKFKPTTSNVNNVRLKILGYARESLIEVHEKQANNISSLHQNFDLINLLSFQNEENMLQKESTYCIVFYYLLHLCPFSLYQFSNGY